MRITWLVDDIAPTASGVGAGVLSQAAALAADHDVRIISVVRSADATEALAAEVEIDCLVDLRDEDAPLLLGDHADPPLTASAATALLALESALVPAAWDDSLSALTDLALETTLRHLEADVVVTTSGSLLATAIQLLPERIVVVHQEPGTSSSRGVGDALLTYAARADVVTVQTATMAGWLREQLGSLAPEILVVPHPVARGFTPRSRLDAPLIVAAGRLAPESQFQKLVTAFADIADRLPTWRLRIIGDGPMRQELVRAVRKAGLYDRVELPGAAVDLPAEWAKASIAASTSRWGAAAPLAVQQAMAAGVPVVAVDWTDGPRHLIEHEVDGVLVAPEFVAGIASGLLRLADDADERRAMGAAAERAARAWHPDTLAERWIGIFADARARRAGRSRVAARSAVASVRRHTAPVPAEPSTATPEQARRETLAYAVECARAVTDQWWVVPRHASPAPVLIVPMPARRAFLERLASGPAPAYLSLREPAGHGWPERRGPVPDTARELARGMSAVLSLEPWPEHDGRASLLGRGCTVDVEFWEESVDDELVSPRPNQYAPRFPRSATTVEAEVEGVAVRTLPLMTAPTVRDFREPIDIVYTWVDGNDPVWDAAREERLAAVTGTARTRESSGRARFISRDELRYSLRSVHLFAPWVRRIHVVTAGQTPPWLDVDHPQIRMVDHRDILAADALPTFNSHAIETGLHRVPDLAEHFVYLNDDVLLGRPARPETFFSPAGHFAAFFSAVTVGLSDVPDAAPFLKAAWNNRRLLQDAFGVVTTHTLAHTPHPHRRSVLDEVARRFPDEVGATAQAPFRSDTDLSMLSSLAQHYGLITGTAYAGRGSLAFVNLSNSDVERRLDQLLADRDHDFICLADHHDHALRVGRIDQVLAEWFEAYYPVAAPWER
ncbi:MAG: glycosyltransferase [Actinobacteria bacterium]|uniref:Unannotated protein n=1 Tax=freshwater metagenome TaxID=449393 RepID=A0A6J6QLA0_9ZZZZ|nr:glycosyltransferase [Actinomycetota bacterium]